MLMEILHMAKSIRRRLDRLPGERRDSLPGEHRDSLPGERRDLQDTTNVQRPYNDQNFEYLLKEMSAVRAELKAHRSELGATLANVMRKEKLTLETDRCE